MVAGAAGGALLLRAPSHPQPRPDPLLAASADLRHDPDGPARAALESQYRARCDRWSGEPAIPATTAGLLAANDALRDAVLTRPHDAGLHRLRGEYLLVLNLPAAALAEFRAAADDGAGAAELALPRAWALLRNGRLETLLAGMPPPEAPPRETAMLRVAQARADEAMGQYGRAAAALRVALAAEPDELDAIARAGMLQLWHGDRGKAESWLERATRIDPAAAPTLRLRGEYAYATGDFAASAAAYGKLVAMHEQERFDPIPPSLGLARAEIYADRLQAASAALDHAGLPADDPALRYYRALLAYRSGAFRRAGELAEPLAGKDGADPALHLLLGGAMLASGFPEIADHELTVYLAAVPGNGAARSMLEDARRRLTPAGAAAPVAPAMLYAAMGFPMDAAR